MTFVFQGEAFLTSSMNRKIFLTIQSIIKLCLRLLSSSGLLTSFGFEDKTVNAWDKTNACTLEKGFQ